MKHYLLGADPGSHGAFALLSTAYDPHLIEADDLILFPFTQKENKKLNVCEMMGFLSRYIDQIQACYLEKVHGIAHSAAAATFGFGFNTGVAYAALAHMCDTPIYEVFPFYWQMHIWKPRHVVWKVEGKKKDTKATSLNAAREIFPGISFLTSPRCRKAHDGCVDAALIAYAALLSSRDPTKRLKVVGE